MQLLASIVAGASVVAAAVLALLYPAWLVRIYVGWVKVLGFLSFACILWVFVTSTSAVANLADRLNLMPNTPLLASESIINRARTVQQEFKLPVILLLVAGLCVSGLARLRTGGNRVGNAA